MDVLQMGSTTTEDCSIICHTNKGKSIFASSRTCKDGHGNQITCRQYRVQQAAEKAKAEAAQKAKAEAEQKEKNRQKSLEDKEKVAISILRSIATEKLENNQSKNLEKFQTLIDYLNTNDEFSNVFMNELHDATQNVQTSEWRKFHKFIVSIPDDKSHLRTAWKTRIRTLFSGNGGVDYGTDHTFFFSGPR